MLDTIAFHISTCCKPKRIQITAIIQQKKWKEIITVHIFTRLVPIMLPYKTYHKKKWWCENRIDIRQQAPRVEEGFLKQKIFSGPRNRNS